MPRCRRRQPRRWWKVAPRFSLDHRGAVVAHAAKLRARELHCQGSSTGTPRAVGSFDPRRSPRANDHATRQHLSRGGFTLAVFARRGVLRLTRPVSLAVCRPGLRTLLLTVRPHALRLDMPGDRAPWSDAVSGSGSGRTYEIVSVSGCVPIACHWMWKRSAAPAGWIDSQSNR